MASKISRLRINGGAGRRCPSWIQSFIDHTEGLESAKVFRKWSAINTIAAALGQNVWIETTSRLYPNLYTILVGYPGVGKTRTIVRAREFLEEMGGLRIAPTSVTAASLIDFLAEQGKPIYYGGGSEVHNSAVLLPDDWQAFMSSFEKDLIGALTVFYDANPYAHNRRGGTIRINIQRPQLNLLAGTTPSDLIQFIPLAAWGQGFTSRVILVYSTEHIVGDDFAGSDNKLPAGMIEDLICIGGLIGPYVVTPEYRQLVNEWRQGDEQPKPDHPKLIHYCTRRRAMLYKLSMVAAADAGDSLNLDEYCFRTSVKWLEDVELTMPAIFDNTKIAEADSIDEVVAWVRSQGGVTEPALIRKMSDHFPSHSIKGVFQVLVQSERIAQVGRKFIAR